MTDVIVQFNVGGVTYSTTKQTLSKASSTSPLARLVDAKGELPEGFFRLADETVFIDRDGDLFSHILHFLRNGKLSLPDGFKEIDRLRDEADFYRLEDLYEQCGGISLGDLTIRPKLSNGGGIISSSENGGYITLGYRGTFAFGRDGQADVKFRKLHRILVCGRVTLCREVFGDSLNESRDPGGPDDGERYTSRLYLKHQCLERACDLMAEKGFKLVATCCSGANGLAAANHPVVSGSGGGSGQTDLMNHRNCGDYEEQRWAHYTEYVFYREPIGGFGASTPSPREGYLTPR